MLNEMLQKEKYYVIPLIGGTLSSETHRSRKETGGCQGLGRGEWGLQFNGWRVSFMQDEKVLEIC